MSPVSFPRSAVAAIALVAAFAARPTSTLAQSVASATESSSLETNAPLPGAPSQPQPQLQPSAAAKHGVETSVAVGAFADLTATRLQNLTNGGILTQSSAPVAGVAWAFRQSFRPWLGYSVNMSFTRTSMHNTNDATQGTASTGANYDTPVDQYELSLSYLAQKRITPKLTGFSELGAGMLTVLPENRGFKPLGTPYYLMPPVTFRPLGVLGLGVDYHFNPRWALRAEYRSLIFKYPDFGGATGKNLTSSSQPTVSLTYSFGTKRKSNGKGGFF
jgi:opacity protein-like surface antigen